MIAARRDEILTRNPDFFSYRYAVAMSKVGELDRAIDMLENGYHQRDPKMVWLPVYPLQTLYNERILDAQAKIFDPLLQRLHQYFDSGK